MQTSISEMAGCPLLVWLGENTWKCERNEVNEYFPAIMWWICLNECVDQQRLLLLLFVVVVVLSLLVLILLLLICVHHHLLLVLTTCLMMEHNG